MKEEPLLLLSDLQKLINQVVLIDYTIIILGGIRMKIKGIGTISKKEAMSILTREGREAVKNGDITTQELGEMYKLEQVKRACKIGTCGDTFRTCYNRIPESLKEDLAPAQLGLLVDSFYNCYSDARNSKTD